MADSIGSKSPTDASLQTKKPSVGIDLGTTNSVIGVYLQGKPMILKTDVGNTRTLPSYVAFTKEERLIGAPAKDQAASNPRNTIFDVKRLIGRKFNDPKVQEAMRHWPFKVEEDPLTNRPLIKVEYKGVLETFTAEEISGMILERMKLQAQEQIGCPITDVVLCVPAHFDMLQREATCDAAKLAGLNVVRLMNEPTAAALTFGLENVPPGVEANVLVFDMGGGTHDVTVLNVADGVFEVKGTGGNAHLGGEEFDSLLVDHFAQQIKQSHSIDVFQNPRTLRRLRTECEKAKITLATAQTARIEMPGILGGEDFVANLMRAQFNKCCEPLFNEAMDCVILTILGAKLQTSDISAVALVGGSTRIDQLKKKLIAMFGEDKLRRGQIDPDEAVAYGATLQAAILNKEREGIVHDKDVVLMDVNPLSIGIETTDGVMDKIIERNSSIPCHRDVKYSTSKVNQKSVRFSVYEGESMLVENNKLIGEFKLTDIPPAPAGVPIFDVRIELTADGFLKVSAKDSATGNEQNITIGKDEYRLNDAEIRKMLQKAEKYAEEERVKVAFIKSRNETADLCNSILTALDKTEIIAVTGDAELKDCVEFAESTIEWLYDEAKSADKATIDARKETMLSKYNPIIKKVYAAGAKKPITDAKREG